MIELYLPLPPSLNQLYGRNRFGGVYKKKAHREFTEMIKAMGMEKKIKPIQGDVELKLIFWMDRKGKDIDNYTKTLFDAFQGILYVNDKQIWKYSVERHYAKPGRVEISCHERIYAKNDL